MFFSPPGSLLRSPYYKLEKCFPGPNSDSTFFAKEAKSGVLGRLGTTMDTHTAALTGPESNRRVPPKQGYNHPEFSEDHSLHPPGPAHLREGKPGVLGTPCVLVQRGRLEISREAGREEKVFQNRGIPIIICKTSSPNNR